MKDTEELIIIAHKAADEMAPQHRHTLRKLFLVYYVIVLQKYLFRSETNCTARNNYLCSPLETEMTTEGHVCG